MTSRFPFDNLVLCAFSNISTNSNMCNVVRLQPNFRFSKIERLTRRKEFEKVFRKGIAVKETHIILYGTSGEFRYSRLGLVVGRKTGNAVQRNRIKRLIREAYRLNKHLLTKAIDIIAIPRPPFTSSLKLSDIESEFVELLLKLDKKVK